MISKGVMMLMLMAAMSLGFASCSKDDDGPNDGGGKGGKMTGWVKVDGKTTDLKFCYGMSEENANGSELGFTAWSKDINKIEPNNMVSFANITVAFTPDGTLDTEYNGQVAFDFEIYLDSKLTYDGTVGGKVYLNTNNLDGITATKDGDKYVIDGKNVEAYWGELSDDEGENLSDLTKKTTVDFHFEGTPTWLKESDFVD